MATIGKDFPVRVSAFCFSSPKRTSSDATSPACKECFDIFSPPPGDNDVTSQIDRLNSNETNIAARLVWIAVGASARSAAVGMVVSIVGGSQPHSARVPVAIHLPMESLLIDRQHQGLIRRINIEPNDILNLLCEVGITRQLER